MYIPVKSPVKGRAGGQARLAAQADSREIRGQILESL